MTRHFAFSLTLCVLLICGACGDSGTAPAESTDQGDTTTGDGDLVGTSNDAGNTSNNDLPTTTGQDGEDATTTDG